MKELMSLMLLGLVIFLGAHAFTAMRAQRAAVIARIGEGAYKGLYSLVSLVGVVLIAWGFAAWRAEGSVPIWDPPIWTRHLALTLMFLASVLLIAAYVPSHMRTRLKHPMLVAIKIWAVAHLLSNGDAATMLLALAVLAWAVFARVSMRRRDDPPKAAPSGLTGDAAAIAAGIVLFLFLAYVFHPYVIGVPVI
jgi:uncharacterized membrane protein